MSVLIVHGTHDPRGLWWLETTLGSFAAEIDEGLIMAGADPQVWRLGNRHVSAFQELRPKGSWGWWRGRTAPAFMNREGRFCWSGADLHGAGRLAAGAELARYLETLSFLSPDETIHIVAHSHGCNVVKQATQDLSRAVRIGRIAFLACPHFVEVQGGGFPYRVNPAVLGGYTRPLLNFYSPQDTVQTTIAELLPDLGMAPGMPKVDMLNFPGTPLVDSYRTDQDPAVAGMYEDLAVPYAGGDGTAAHGAVHNPEVGRFLGYWFGQPEDASAVDCWDEFGLGNLRP